MAGRIALDASMDAVLTAAKVGTRLWGLGVTRDGNKLYAADGPGNNVSVLDAKTLDLVKTVPVGSMP